ncbi:TetR/AcrR family transcriptional regulator [Actinomadura sp. DC4]|uniref:TetR/AcrR family transcriptional regulator n=1 Tax=Actinomadura sp. DC4 TaxID=3055069 RepID=UPI0025AFE84B|nr:TetR/AcrR family transcriptional regulator [Actinomadura sp. DC4]MDN3358273.1 TetR/AcrR family transcriptional regulator [Actinomadura sp. DC4]
MSEPRRPGRAEVNRRRILAVAADELSRDPDLSMDDIARAAGVVRRTVYGHFPSREALIAGIADEAAREVTEALGSGAENTASPVEALVISTMATWEIGDRYRLLIALAQRSLTAAGMRDHLRPARERLAGLLEEGARSGDFAGHLPAAVLAQGLESLLLGLLQAVNEGVWESAEPARDAARACLIAAGVPAARADAAVTAAVRPSASG